MHITNKIGPPVEGDDFYGRIEEIANANKLLDENNSLILSAPRRIGKSSFAKRLVEEKKKQGWKCVYIDLEETHSEEGFLSLLLEEFSKNNVWRQITEGLSKRLRPMLDIIEQVSIGPITLNLCKKEEKDNLYKSIKELIKHEDDTFIVIDELALFLSFLSKKASDEEQVTFILNWLRSLRQVSRTKVRWLFCGSVGLINFTSAKQLSYTINDLRELKLDELSHTEAYGLLSELCISENVEMSDELKKYTIDKLLWNIPYFIQIMFSKIFESYKKGEITRDKIDVAYQELCTNNYLNTWSERLVEYQENELLARKILKILCTSPLGMERKQLFDGIMKGYESSKTEIMDFTFSHVLEMLENDGYIIKNGTLRVFRSPVLRDYWNYRFVQ